jgi:hypothetical protein
MKQNRAVQVSIGFSMNGWMSGKEVDSGCGLSCYASGSRIIAVHFMFHSQNLVTAEKQLRFWLRCAPATGK